MKNNPEMSNASLANNLKYLESEGLIVKKLMDDPKHTTEYYLTDKGRKMNRILYEMILFGLDELIDLDDEDLKRQTQEFYEGLLNN